MSAVYPDELQRAEAALVAGRRAFVEPTGSGRPQDRLPEDSVGIGLSGGGIRSATFCLGFFQALAEHGLLRKLDFMSTVSGGGYFGSFLGALISRADRPDPGASGTGVFAAEDYLADPRSKPLSWLRESGRYLSPNGSGDEILAAAVYLRNWVAMHVVLSTLVFATFSGALLLRSFLDCLFGFEEGWQGLTRGAVWWSPYLVLPAAVFLFAAFPLGWGYWFTQKTRRSKGRFIASEEIPWITGFLVFLISLAVAVWWRPEGDRGISAVFVCAAVIAVTSLEALVAWKFVAVWARRKAIRDEGLNPPKSDLRLSRNRLSTHMAHALWLAVGLFVFALIDSLGQTLYAHLPGWVARGIPVAGPGLGLIAVAIRKLALLKASPTRTRAPLSVGMIASLISVLLLGVILVGLAGLTYALAWSWRPPQILPPLTITGVLFSSTVLLSLLFGLSIKFLNLSSHQALYGARITRAYLGASNRKRWEDPRLGKLTELVSGDEMPLDQYAPHARGGPLHLINVTFNETLDGKTQTEQRDRKGMALAVGPCGLSGGVWHHARWPEKEGKRSFEEIVPIGFAGANNFHLFAGETGASHPVEALDLGTWTSISGAAFTTGLGARSSLGLSTLLGLANVRLGYWWDSGVRPDQRDACRTSPGGLGRAGEWLNEVLPVQTHFLQELLARFYGPNRLRWYLSDGGHFENTAGYELIRRRLPFIILCDDGQDEDYSFADLANLVRKVRTDFNAEIEFLRPDQVEAYVPAELRSSIGTLRDLRPAEGEGEPGRSRAHATLAWVYYHDPAGGDRGRPRNPEEAGSVILLVKPTLTSDEPLDVQEYKRSHPTFPQEPTSDQYFDEAQWESYRKLGQHIGRRLFASPPEATVWTPSSLRPPHRRAAKASS